MVLVLGLLAGDVITDKEPGPGPGSGSAHTSTGFATAAESRSPVVPTRVPYADRLTPMRLRIPAIDVVGDIQPVGMTDDVTMQVPGDISVIGWFDRSVTPSSEVGNTVLVGHRDGVSDPNGVFRRLGELGTGDEVRVRDLSGRVLKYEVSSVRLLDREEFADEAEGIFAIHGPHRLILVTCGGNYDAGQGGYQANYVVVATRT